MRELMTGTVISLNLLREQDLLSRESRSRERLSALQQQQRDAALAACGSSEGRNAQPVSDVRIPMPPPS